MTVVTQKLTNIAGVSRVTPVHFTSPAVRTSGTNLVTEDVQVVNPVNGVITVDLQPGPASVMLSGREFAFTVPAEGTPTLSTLIAAALGIPAGTPDVVVGAAVEAYLMLNPPSGGGGLTEEVADTRYVPFSRLAKNPDLLITGSITRDVNGAVTSAAAVWPDGTPGTFTAETLSTAHPGAVDGYRITYGSPATKTYTQPTMTRNSEGAVTAVPAIVVS